MSAPANLPRAPATTSTGMPTLLVQHPALSDAAVARFAGLVGAKPLVRQRVDCALDHSGLDTVLRWFEP